MPNAHRIASRYLVANGEALVASWIDWVRARVQTSTISALPERALRNHIPPILQSLARYMENPVEFARQELLSHLRLHGQIRRDQGYSLEEVLAEFDGLAEVVTRGVHRSITMHAGDSDQEEVLEVTSRLASGLRSISFIAMGTFSRSDDERRVDLSAGLEEFARAVSHEFRGPLNTISLSSDLLRHQTRENADAQAQLDAIDSAVKRSTYLLETIRVLAMAEHARAGTRLVDLDAALGAVVRELREECSSAGVEIRVAENIPKVRAESVLLYVVLINVLGNAVKYSNAKHEDRWVLVSARTIEEEHDSGFCEIKVEDNGVGIPEEFKLRVFQRGFRAHPERAQGTGLGLYLLQQAVTARGGTVLLESTEGVGTTVVIRVRCLHHATGSLTADQFRVEHLMGETVWLEESMPELPPDTITLEEVEE